MIQTAHRSRRWNAFYVSLSYVFRLVPFFLALSSVTPLLAYSDKIAVPIEEVWQAANEALAPYGVRRVNEEKKHIESDWMEDRVLRSRGLLKNIAAKLYQRRYRIRIQLAPEEDYATQVKIEGIFQERPLDAKPILSWRTVKRETADYKVEYDFFTKVLKQLETHRTPSSS